MYRSIINSEEGLLHSAVLNPMLRMGVCPDCGGTRLNEKARSCLIEGKSIADVCSMSISRLRVWVDGLADPLAADLKAAIGARLAALEEIGLGYLSLDRGVGTLSGGEAQRCKIAKYINSSLSDVLYILDEPSVGLHNRDIELMKRSVLRLRDAGNTVLLVEHHRELIGIADWVVDLGPGPGADGGRIIFEGTYPELLRSSTATGRLLGDSLPFKEHVRSVEKCFLPSRTKTFSPEKKVEKVLSDSAIENFSQPLNIAQVMDLSVRKASEFFAGTVIEQKLRPLVDVGLQYLHLNQALSTLSGGELQRLKLASYLGEEGKIFIIDEPTDGLHTKDVRHILKLLDSLVERGNTVWLIEHNTDVIRSSDYVIELGPGAGENGGRVIFAGLPSEMPKAKASVTGPYL